MTLLTFDPSILEDIIVPIFICFALPVGIVFLVMWAKNNTTNKKAEVALKSIEAGIPVDPSFFGKQEKARKIKARLFGELKVGMILTGLGLACLTVAYLPDGSLEDFGTASAALIFLGLAFIAYFFIAKKHFAKEIKAEEDNIGKEE